MKSTLLSGAILALLMCTAAVPSLAADSQKAMEERNKQIAIDFYNAALNEKNWEKTRSYIGNRYVQHNLGAIDGPEGLKAHIEFLKREFPKNHGEIKQALADGDLVALHIHNRRSPELRGNAIVDIFRIENGKVVEGEEQEHDVLRFTAPGWCAGLPPRLDPRRTPRTSASLRAVRLREAVPA
ncbi:MAG: nuclear transport factor 2 family protein [Pseudomonadota bacterium]